MTIAGTPWMPDDAEWTFDETEWMSEMRERTLDHADSKLDESGIGAEAGRNVRGMKQESTVDEAESTFAEADWMPDKADGVPDVPGLTAGESQRGMMNPARRVRDTAPTR